MKPIIYQLFPRTFTNYNSTRKRNGSKEENGCGKFNDLTTKALKSIQELGANYIWYTGVIRHATAEYNTPSITKGKAGSPYAITDYYDVDPDLAVDESKRMAEFEGLISRTHKLGMKVVIDFVPNHVSREYKSNCKPKGVKDLGQSDHPEWAFSPLNNFYYLPGEKFAPQFDIDGYEEFPAKVTGNDCFTSHPSQNDWYETIKLNYGVHYMGGGEKQFSPIPSTWKKMLDILHFWARKGVDAFRVDMAEMVPVEFWKWVIPYIHTYFHDVQFIAECYNPQLYHSYLDAGFDYLYDKVGMYDYLRGVTSKDWPAEGITHQWQAVEGIRDHMLYFLENHDEQRLASGFFCGRGLCAEPAMIVAATLGTNPVMIYAGQELGETGMDAEGYSGMDGRSSIFDYWGLKSLQAWANSGKFDGKLLTDEQKDLRSFYQTLLTLSRDNKAIQSGLMYDLEYAQAEGFNKHKQYAYLRKADDEIMLIAVNFADRVVDLDIRIPHEAFAYLKQEEWGNAQAVDMLTNTKYKKISLTCSQPIHLSLPAWKGVILQIKNSSKKKK
ncbi:MAG: alpha-amylase family glycosyl hydrolase [Paludibacteraceae bacterium]|nr:alpha-amylase family glycosyl hydrolase [Paludibacteraceae bacterium]